MNNLSLPLLTSNYIIDETLTLVKDRLGHHIAIKIGKELWNEEAAHLVRVTSTDEQNAWALFVKYHDKGFSFTDCTSFVLMKRLKITTVFTFDEHFDQYGKFQRVPFQRI